MILKQLTNDYWWLFLILLFHKYLHHSYYCREALWNSPKDQSNSFGKIWTWYCLFHPSSNRSIHWWLFTVFVYIFWMKLCFYWVTSKAKAINLQLDKCSVITIRSKGTRLKRQSSEWVKNWLPIWWALLFTNITNSNNSQKER